MTITIFQMGKLRLIEVKLLARLDGWEIVGPNIDLGTICSSSYLLPI